METLLTDISIIIIIATVGALIARWLKQPIIPAYIITGIVLGPVLGWITDAEVVGVLADIGIAFLLFIVGLELDLDRIRNIGIIASVGGLVQVAVTFAAGFIASIALGFGPLQSSYLGLVVAFSSTFVVIKLLSDKREIDSLHGRIIIGMLLVQDIVAVLALSVFDKLGMLTASVFIAALLKGGSLFLAAYILAVYVAPQLFHFAAKSNELLFLSSLAVMFAFSMGAEWLGYSMAIGGFIAGITLGNLPYQVEIIGRVKPLRDFFATLFFVALGLRFVVTDFQGFLWPLIILSALVILFKPFVLLIIGHAFGYSRRTSFLLGLCMGQVSEFSLILLLKGSELGHISPKLFTFAILLTIITITASSYLINYDAYIVRKFAKRLKWFKNLGAGHREMRHLPHKKYDALLVGCDRAGSVVLSQLRKQGHKTVVVDFNPVLVRKLIKKGVPVIYGDIADPEVVEHIDFKHLWICVSTVPEVQTNKALVRTAKRRHKRCLVFVTANTPQEALELYNLGADYVILPHLLGGEHVALLLKHRLKRIRRSSSKGHVESMRERHIQDLRERLEL